MLDIKKFRIDSENFIAGIKQRRKGNFGNRLLPSKHGNGIFVDMKRVLI